MGILYKLKTITNDEYAPRLETKKNLEKRIPISHSEIRFVLPHFYFAYTFLRAFHN